MPPVNLGVNRERNAEMIRRYMAGEDLAPIGRDYGISRERVRQIAKRAGAWRKRTYRETAPRVGVTCPRCQGKRRQLASSRVVYCSMLCANSRTGLWTPESTLAGLRDLADSLGRTPTQHEINSATVTPSHTLLAKLFGSLTAAHAAAGLIPRTVGGAGHLAFTEGRND